MILVRTGPGRPSTRSPWKKSNTASSNHKDHMTPREYAKQNRHIGEAWEEGKAIQYMSLASNQWDDHTRDTRPSFGNPAVKWRIKPEPPQPKYRPFIHTEVPVGAEVRYKGNQQSCRQLIVSSQEHGMFGCGSKCSYPALLETKEWKWPHEPETAWRPCGVEVAP